MKELTVGYMEGDRDRPRRLPVARPRMFAILLLIIGLLAQLTSPAQSEAQAGATLSGYVAIAPTRVVDSRTGFDIGPFDTPWAAGDSRSVQLTGAAGVPSNASSVAMHITTINATAQVSWLTVHPSGTSRPTTASVNFGTAPYTASIENNLVVSKVNAAGKVDVYNAYGNVDLIIDIVGYYSPNSQGTFVPTTPERIVDTAASNNRWGPGEARNITITGIAGVPATGVEAVFMNIGTNGPTAQASWLTVHPSGTARPNAAAMNFGRSPALTAHTNNLVIAEPGSNGKTTIYNAAGHVDLTIDIVGYQTTSGERNFVSLSPARVLDTRTSGSPLVHGQTRSVQFAGVGGVPATGVTGVMFNATTVNPTAGLSHLSIRASGASDPGTSALDFGTVWYAAALSNGLTVAKVGSDGRVDITNAVGNTDLVIDVVGYFTATAQAPTWAGEEVLTLDQLGFFDFTVSWPPTTGAPDVFEVTITDSSGGTSLEVIDARTNGEARISEFQQFALDSTESYSVKLVAVNTAGRSPVLELGPLQVLTVNYETTLEGLDSNGNVTFGSANAAPAGTSTASGVWSLSDCLRLTTRAVVGESSIFGQDNQFHTVVTEICHDGNFITKNVVRPDQHGCLDRSIWPGILRDPDTAIELNPDYRGPNASIGLVSEYAANPVSEQHIIYLCSFTEDLELSNDSFGSTTVNLGEGSNIRHELRVIGGNLHWERFATPTG